MTSRLRAVSIMALFLLIASACSAASDASASDSTVRTADQASGTTATTSESTTESTTSSSPPSIVDTDPDAGSDAGSGEGNFSARVDPIPAEQLGSIGDPLFPSLGNLGYDVLKYDIGINLTGTEFAAETVVTLRAVQELERFHLDLVGLDVIEIRIDDEPALFNRDGRELMIRPPQPLERGQTYDVYVAYEGTPQPIADPATPSVLGWISEPWGTYVVSEPLGAATWFPANDHPRDKAVFDFAVTVPAGVTVAASGKLTGTTDAPANAGPEGSTTFNYAAADPMATYLASVVTGDFILTEPTEVGGIQIRHAVHSSIPETFAKELDTTTEMMVAFEEQFGPYPFESYGVVVVPENLGFALENQTLSIFGRDLLASESAQPILAHELAHQWFGNSVSVHEWDDIWLNEGFATWAEYWWRDRLVGPNSDILELFSEVPFDPLQPVPAEELFDGNVYIRGGLTLEAYERLVGPDEFREFLLEWSARYADATASNEQFLQLVEELHGPDVASALDPWIFDQTMPILPPK